MTAEIFEHQRTCCLLRFFAFIQQLASQLRCFALGT
jgi:hypothetical protein